MSFSAGMRSAFYVLALTATLPMTASTALASGARSDKLVLTGGVNAIEGAGGGGLATWALIGGLGTEDQFGGNAFYTNIAMDDFRLTSSGVLLGIRDRVELSLARQRLDTQDAGSALGIGRGFKISQDIFGIKVRLLGDAVLEQDSWLPQVSAGLQHKRNDQAALLQALGARDDSGTDFYLAASKLYLSSSVLLNATVRLTKANQLGLLGFGGDRNDSYRPQIELSAALLLRRDLALGAEYRSKPDNLSFADEGDWASAFIAWQPNKNIAVTIAYTALGDIATFSKQRGAYISLQLGF